MGGLFSKKIGRKEILMLGLDDAGKTTTLYQIRSSLSVPTNELETTPTIGCNTESISYNKVKLNVMDLSGMQASRSLWSHNYESTHAIIFVIDSADEKRFEENKNEIHNVINHESIRESCIFLFLANKQDVDNALNEDELAEALDLLETGRNVAVFPTNVREADGLETALDWLINELKHQPKN
eukprot:TRINITY_DN42_c0_g1_i1.p1 TRINITY_DN42_c0_g1~~TRINITY_DN42_c0_g1_i1.p1  ORF type:complete len:183 (-),score=40.80 TRINITY_DN42_c0_g1_i1:64-612(-)